MFIMLYGYMASDISLRTILIVRKETCCRHIGYSYRLTARVLLYAPSHTQDNTYHGLCYTSRGALAGTSYKGATCSSVVTGPDGAVVMSSANGPVGTGFASHTGSNPERVFKGPMGRCMATTLSSLSLTSNRVTTNY